MGRASQVTDEYGGYLQRADYALGSGLGARNMLVNKKSFCSHRVRKGWIELPHIAVTQCDRGFKPDVYKAQMKKKGMGERSQGRLSGRRGDGLAECCDMYRSLTSRWRVESVLRESVPERGHGVCKVAEAGIGGS